MNKVVIYTCIVGLYDQLLQPLAIDPRFDYVCFTDNPQYKDEGIWQLRPIPFKHTNKSRISRFPKILPHKVLPEYEYSVYIDANLQIADKEFYDIIIQKIDDGCIIAQVPHVVPPVDCIYDELANAYKYNKATFLQVFNQSLYLKRYGFPHHFGLFENNLIFRKHNDDIVVGISNQWWKEYMNKAPRDQFSLMYVYWKNNFMPDLLFDKNTCTRNCLYIKYNSHLHEQKQFSTTKIISNKWHHIMFHIVKFLLK